MKLQLPTRLLAPAFFLFGSAACVKMTAGSERATPTNRAATVARPAPNRTEFTPPTGRGERVSKTALLHAVEATHTFSNPTAPDRFVLELRGARVLSGRLRLLVLSAGGDTLRQQALPLRALLDEAAPTATAREQEIAVLRGMSGFFGPEHFTTDRTGAITFRYPDGAGAMSRLRAAPASGQLTLLSE